MGNGLQLKIWDDEWVRPNSFGVSFRRLYMMSEQENQLVDLMGVWVKGVLV